MQLGLIGLGRMGSNMAHRLMRGGHQVVVFDSNGAAVRALENQGAIAAGSLDALVTQLDRPRAVWLMVPAGAVGGILDELVAHLNADDTVIDGGNSYYVDDLSRAEALGSRGIHYVDVGTSGGVRGLERGYCLMIGGPEQAARSLDPIFKTLAPGRDAAPRTPGREKHAATVEEGYLYCGPPGAGHFVKMVHNGIEYGLMAAYAEGLNVLRHANAGRKDQAVNAETTPLAHPERYHYDFDVADIAEVWRRGSVISSWLLDLTASALLDQPDLAAYSKHVADSGEGRWTALAAIEEGVSTPVLCAALFQRFASRGNDDFAAKVLSAMRHQFGGHAQPGE